MIFGGFAGGGETSSVKKAHMRKVRTKEMLEVQIVNKAPWMNMDITFSNADLEGY